MALFAFAAETLRTSNDDDVLRAENAAVARLGSRMVVGAPPRFVWRLDAFPDPESGRALPPLGAAVRGGGGVGLRPHERRPPSLLYCCTQLARAPAAAAPLEPGPRRSGPGPGGGHSRVRPPSCVPAIPL